MRAIACEMPDEPSIDGAEGEFAPLSARSRARDMIQQPGDLGTAEIRVYYEASPLAHQTLGTDPPQFIAQRRGAPVLPDDCVVQRLAALPVPHYGGFALVGNAHCHQV